MDNIDDELRDALTDYFLRHPPGDRAEGLVEAFEAAFDEMGITGPEREEAMRKLRVAAMQADVPINPN